MTTEDQAKLDQVALQCRAVKHLCLSLVEVYEAHEHLFSEHHAGHALLADMIGDRTAALMEHLGEHLNGIDAVDKDADEWLEPVFREAQKRWPQAS